MKKFAVLLAAIFLLGGGTVAYSFYSAHRDKVRREAELTALFQAIDRAEDSAKFIGVRTTGFKSGETEYSTTVRLYADGDRRKVELLTSTSSKGSGRTTGWLGGLPSSWKPGHGTRGRFHRPDLIIRNYHVRMRGRKTCAGREADEIEIVSRHAGRPSYVVLADVATRFPLGFEVRNDAGMRIFESRYEVIEFDPVFPEGVFEKKRKNVSWIKATETDVALDKLPDLGFPAWVVTEPPPGCELVAAKLFRVTTTQPILFNKNIDIPILHVTYSDGMALFSAVLWSRENEVWQMLRGCIPELKNPGGLVAQKFTFATGMALLIETDKTVVLLAGNVSGADLEDSARSLVQRP